MRKLVIRVVVVVLALSALYPLYKGISATMQARHASSPSTTLDDGLVGHWTFDGADMTSTTALDKSGNGNTGTLTNMATSSRVAGALGQGLLFDGVDDRIAVSDNSTLDLTSVTLSAWVYKTARAGCGGRDSIISKGDQGAGLHNYELLIADDCSIESLSFRYYNGGWAGTGDSTSLSLNRWYHLVASYNDSADRIDFYIDGVLRSSATTTLSLLTNNQSLSIGARDSINNRFHGKIDDVRIYNRALSADEIHQLYVMGEGTTVGVDPTSDPLAEGLAGYWKFDEVSGVTSIDSSMNGNNGTLTNGPTRTTGKIGGAVTFDGTDDFVHVPGDIGALNNASAFSISAWFNRTGTGGSSGTAIFAKGTHMDWGNDVDLMLDNGSLLFAQVNNGADGAASFDYSGIYTHGTWAHVLLVYDGTQTGNSNRLKIYFNGVQQSLSFATYTVPATTANLAGDDQYIGRYIDGSNGWTMKGSIDEVRLYNRALSPEEVDTLYRTTKPTEVDASLVGHWTFDGPTISGTTVYDRSGAGNNGTLTNGPTKTAGVFGQGLQFDGVDDYVTVLHSGSLGFNYGNDFSVYLWVKLPPTQVSTPYIDTEILTKDGYPYALRVLNQTYGTVADRGKVVALRWDGTNNPGIASNSQLNDNKWHQISFIKNGATLSLYVDGILNGTAVDTTNQSATSEANLSIGSRQTDHNLQGTIDDVRIYNRALTADEIYKMYKAGAGSKMNVDTVTPDLERGLAGYWPLDNATGTTASDLSVNRNNGTLTNGPTWTTGKIGGAVDFDGSNDYIDAGIGVPVAGKSTMTLSTWVKINSFTFPSGFFHVMGRYYSGDSDRVIAARITNSTSVVLVTDSGSAQLASSVTVPTLSTGTWYHMTWTYSAGSGSFYLNGVKQGDFSGLHSTLNALPVSSRFTMGRDSSAAGAGNASLDEVRLYNRALSADEVATLYRTTKPTQASDGLVGYWSFNGPDVTDKVYDRSGAGNNGYFVGGATTSAKTIGKVGQGLQFDGVDDYVGVGNYSADVGSISMWFKSEFSFNPSNWYALYGGSTSGSNWSLGVNTFDDTNSIDFSIRGSFGATLTAKGTNHGSDDAWLQQWHHVVATWNTSTGLQLFVDGVLDGTVSGSTGSLATMNFTVGNTPFKGTIDEVRRYNRALSAQEVKQLYSAGR